MSCDQCKDVIEQPDQPHVIRLCPGCGRELRIVERGEHGIGIRIQKGDRFEIPGGWLTFSFDPVKSAARLTPAGLNWFAEQLYLGDVPNAPEMVVQYLSSLQDQTESTLKQSQLLSGFDLENESQAEALIAHLGSHKDTKEWWSFMAHVLAGVADEAIKVGDAPRAAWAVLRAERARAMIIFHEHLRAVVWMGHSAKRIVDLMHVWDANKGNGDEEFWQHTFRDNSYALAQIFATPVLLLKDKAYVGGTQFDRKDAKVVDYLFSGEASREAILVEIKTPITKLLNATEYRTGVYPPSSDLTGAVGQVQSYRLSLVRDYQSITRGMPGKFADFIPRCVLLVGNGNDQLTDPAHRESFENYRRGLKDVDVITYDELFRKVELLAELFSLKRMPPSSGKPDKGQ